MDLAGHCYVAELSGTVPEEFVYGPGVVETMFLNYSHCHDWAYEHCWEPERWPRFQEQGTRLRAHMIADWTVHYGFGPTHLKIKQGWAFSRPETVGAVLAGMFEEARALGVCDPAHDIQTWSDKRRADVVHSLVEYAADVAVAEKVVTAERFAGWRRSLSRLGEKRGYGTQEWAHALFDGMQCSSDRTLDFRGASMIEMAGDAEDAEAAWEFPVRTALRKCGLPIERDWIHRMRRHLDRLLGSMSWDEIAGMMQAAANVVKDHSAIYTGPWSKSGITTERAP